MNSFNSVNSNPGIYRLDPFTSSNANGLKDFHRIGPSLFKALPVEIIKEIFSHLGLMDLQKQLEVSKDWKIIAADPKIYIKIFQSHLFQKRSSVEESNQTFYERTAHHSAPYEIDFKRNFKMELRSDPKFLTEAAKQGVPRRLFNLNPSFPGINGILKNSDVQKLNNHRDLALQLIRQDSSEKDLFIGDDLKKNEDFLLEAIKINGLFLKYLTPENQAKHAETIILTIFSNNINCDFLDPDIMDHLSPQFIEQHEDFFLESLKTEPKNLIFTNSAFQIKHKGFIAELHKQPQFVTNHRDLVKPILKKDPQFIEMRREAISKSFSESLATLQDEDITELELQDIKNRMNTFLNRMQAFFPEDLEISHELNSIYHLIYKDFPQIHLK